MNKDKNKIRLKYKHSGLCGQHTAHKYIKSECVSVIKMVTVKIKRKTLNELMNQIAYKPAESGGILLGPIGTNDITNFYFDQVGICTNNRYTPDYKTLNRKMKEEWLPAGLDMKGFVHSHPGNLDSLTAGDMSYIKKLLSNNPDMNLFVAPIVLPYHRAIRAHVVTRDKINYPQQAYFEIVD